MQWAYEIKTQAYGYVVRYKAHLVVRGLTQDYGIDYNETFTLVTWLTSFKSLLTIVAIQQWNMFQMDVKNAFLNGDLDEKVYLIHPPVFEHLHPNVCCLRKAL